MSRFKSYLLGFPLLRLFAFAAPYKARLAFLGLVIALSTAADIAGPLIVGYAIDYGLGQKGGISSDLRIVYLAVAFYVFVNVAAWVLGYLQTFGMG